MLRSVDSGVFRQLSYLVKISVYVYSFREESFSSCDIPGYYIFISSQNREPVIFSPGANDLISLRHSKESYGVSVKKRNDLKSLSCFHVAKSTVCSVEVYVTKNTYRSLLE